MLHGGIILEYDTYRGVHHAAVSVAVPMFYR